MIIIIMMIIMIMIIIIIIIIILIIIIMITGGRPGRPGRPGRQYHWFLQGKRTVFGDRDVAWVTPFGRRVRYGFPYKGIIRTFMKGRPIPLFSKVFKESAPKRGSVRTHFSAPGC